MLDENEKSTDNFETILTNAADPNKKLTIIDRSGLKITPSGLMPLTEADDNETIWGGSIILNSGDMEFPSTSYKLRATTKRQCKGGVTCNRSKGIIPKNQIIVIAFQLPESSITSTSLTLLIDCNPHEIPLYKVPKADFYWLGRDTKVPTASQLRTDHLLKSTNIMNHLRSFAKEIFLDLANLENELIPFLDKSDCTLEEEIAQEILRRFQNVQLSK